MKQTRLNFNVNQSNVNAIALEIYKIEQENQNNKFETIESIEELRNLSLTSRLCTQDQFITPEYHFWCNQLKIEPVFHRKYWEWYFICQVLWENKKLGKNFHGCGFVNVGLEIPNFVGIIIPTLLKSFVNSLSNIRKPLFCRFVFIHP